MELLPEEKITYQKSFTSFQDKWSFFKRNSNQLEVDMTITDKRLVLDTGKEEVSVQKGQLKALQSQLIRPSSGNHKMRLYRIWFIIIGIPYTWIMGSLYDDSKYSIGGVVHDSGGVQEFYEYGLSIYYNPFLNIMLLLIGVGILTFLVQVTASKVSCLFGTGENGQTLFQLNFKKSDAELEKEIKSKITSFIYE